MADEKKEEPKKESQDSSAKEGVVLNTSDAKLKAALGCIPIIGLVLYFIEANDQRIRFYSAQGALIGVAGIILEVIPVVNLFGWILIVGAIALTAMKAYQTEENYKLPLLGDWAEQLAKKKF